MKRILTLTAIAAASLLAFSCKSEPATGPIVEFGQIIYQVENGVSVDVSVVVSAPAESTLSIPVTFAGTAVKGTDYTVSADVVTIAAQQTEGSISISAVSLDADKQISLSFTVPAGYRAGTKATAVINWLRPENIAYSFEVAENDVIESYVATLRLTGERSGIHFKAEQDISIPFVLGGAGASELEADAEAFVIKQGGDNGKVTFTPKKEAYDEPLIATLSLNTEGQARLLEGENPRMVLNVKGGQSPEKLLGTWVFDKMLGQDAYEEFYEMAEDDLDLLPTHNDGFTLTFTKEEDGTVTLTPNNTGDFANYFRTATLTLTEPLNPCKPFTPLGKYSNQENNGILGADAEGSAYQVCVYYKLSQVNYKFSATEEDLKPATVCLSLTSANDLIVQIKEFDTEEPAFGEGLILIEFEGEFDPDFMSFPARFKKAQ